MKQIPGSDRRNNDDEEYDEENDFDVEFHVQQDLEEQRQRLLKEKCTYIEGNNNMEIDHIDSIKESDDRNMHDEHDIIDKIKSLNQTRLESERDISIFAGALDLLQHQLSRARESKCPVCDRKYGAPEEIECSAKQLQIRIKEMESTRNESNVVAVYEECMKALEALRHSPVSPFRRTDLGLAQNNQNPQSRVSFNMKTGSLTELRNQKIECLVSKQCLACLRVFKGDEAPEFLRRIDYLAGNLSRELHIHQ